MKFLVFQECNDLWYWELRTSDEMVVAASPKGLKTRELAIAMIDIVRGSVGHCAVFDRAGNLYKGV